MVGGSTESTKQEVIDALREALSYRGDDGSHPSLDYLDRMESKKDFDEVVFDVQKIRDRSTRVVAF